MPYSSPLVYNFSSTADGYFNSDSFIASVHQSGIDNASNIKRIDSEGNKILIYFDWLMPDQDKVAIDSVVASHAGSAKTNHSFQQAAATNTIQTTSSSLVLATGMTLTPGVGSYLALFSGGLETPNTATCQVSIYANGSEVTVARRKLQGDAGLTSATPAIPFTTVAFITVSNGQSIEGRWSCSIGTASMYQRSLSLIKIS